MKHLLVICLSAVVAISGPAFAKPDHAGKKQAQVEKKVAKAEAKAVRKFSAQDRDAVVVYYRKHGLPPGIAKKLPPRWETQVVVGAPVPPAILEAAVPMPPLLPPPPPGIGFMMIGPRAVQVDLKTNVVIDMFDIGP